MPPSVSRAWLAIAVAVSTLLVLGAPFVSQIASTLRDVARGNYASVLAAIVLGATAVAVLIALVRIRDRRVARYAWL
jgi:hypothetical protein